MKLCELLILLYLIKYLSILNLIHQYIIPQIIYRDIKFHVQIYMKFNNISNSVLENLPVISVHYVPVQLANE